ncbi:MAG: 4Fe-4S dicluster domain-containing protein [Oscillospiraceae bacterium]|jgi:Na+-translocating ferredoxin:NAD+ oxidoreductase subunit C
MPCGVKLECKKEPSLKNDIITVRAPKNLPAPKMFAPPHKKASASKILSAARAAGIVDEIDGEPLDKKLSRVSAAGNMVLIAVCFDEDPMTSAEQAVLRESPSRVLKGLEFACKAGGVSSKKIAVASREEIQRVKKSCLGVSFLIAGNRYPALAILRRKLAAKGEKVCFIGAQACVALEAAVNRGMAQSETVITVAGDGVARWLNCRVRIGTPIKDVLPLAEPTAQTAAVVVGSSINGRCVNDLSETVTPVTRCIIVLEKLPRRKEMPCVGCGWCERVCPRGIIPWMILQQLESESPNPFRLFNVERCIRCEACSVVCPSQIHLADVVKRAEKIKEGKCNP